MRMFLLLAVVFGCVVLCGCSSLETNRVGAQLTIKCELELEPVVEIREESVMGTGSASSFMGIVNWGASTRAVGVPFTEKSSNLPMFTGGGGTCSSSRCLRCLQDPQGGFPCHAKI